MSRRRVRLSVRHISRLTFLLLAAECHGGAWEPRRIDLPYPLEPSDVVWIWSGGKVEKWHGVVITPDSVSGIPYGTSLKCDSCRRSIPRAQVDSVKLGHKTGVAPTPLTYVGVLAAVLVLEIVVCSALGAQKAC